MADWFYNEDSGAVDSQSGVEAWFNRNTGVNTIQKKFGGWHGPFPTKEAAFQYYLDNKAAHPEWKEPTDSLWKTFTNSTGVLSTDLFGQFNAGNWFIRISEILLGIVLIGVGVAKLTGAPNAISTFAKVV
jgi:hypothetical protein